MSTIDMWPVTKHYLGEASHVSVEDQMRNLTLVLLTKTRFKRGQVVKHHGYDVRITAVMPKGFITWSASTSQLGRMLDPVICDQPLYRFEAVNPRAGGSPSGQTTEDHLTALG